METKPSTAEDLQSEELADNLTAISVLAKMLASKIRSKQDNLKKGEKSK